MCMHMLINALCAREWEDEKNKNSTATTKSTCGVALCMSVTKQQMENISNSKQAYRTLATAVVLLVVVVVVVVVVGAVVMLCFGSTIVQKLS